MHVFLFGETCAGEHAEHHTSRHGHGEGTSSGHEHQHQNHSNEVEAEHHEPCDHEFLDFEGEWLARATHSTSIEFPKPNSLPSAEISQLAAPQWTKVSTEYPPRAPPRRHESSDHFLATIRLLI